MLVILIKIDLHLLKVTYFFCLKYCCRDVLVILQKEFLKKLFLVYKWFSRYVIAAMLVDDRKQKISHWLLLFVHQQLYIAALLSESLEIGCKPPIQFVELNKHLEILKNTQEVREALA